MTIDELRAIGLAAYGVNWQSPLARAIGISPRHMRRLIAGESPITEGIAADIRRALGATAVDPDWPRDKWIIGDAPAEADTKARREYLVHTRRPRFVARVVMVDDDGEPEPADVITGVVYASEDYVLSEIVWIDPPPPAASCTG